MPSLDSLAIPGPTQRRRVHEHVGAEVTARPDRVVVEEPVEIRLEWPGAGPQQVAVTMRTPGHDFELAVGLLLSEGLLPDGAVRAVRHCVDQAGIAGAAGHTTSHTTSRNPSRNPSRNTVSVLLDRPPRRLPQLRGESLTAISSACGVCGADSVEAVARLAEVRPEQVSGPGGAEPELVTVTAEVLRTLPDRLRAEQRVFSSTGGLHATGLFEADGRLLVLREDVGRHNAFDKAVGARVLRGEPTAVPLACVSGRVGFEIAQKAVAAGVGTVAAIGAPTSLAVELAERTGLGLVGFLSARRFVVYAGEERISA